jgi:hypothetical protein
MSYCTQLSYDRLALSASLSHYTAVHGSSGLHLLEMFLLRQGKKNGVKILRFKFLNLWTENCVKYLALFITIFSVSGGWQILVPRLRSPRCDTGSLRRNAVSRAGNSTQPCMPSGVTAP